MIEMEVEQKNQESTCQLGDRKAKKPAHCPTGTDTNFKCPDKKKLVRMSRPQSFSLRPPSTFIASPVLVLQFIGRRTLSSLDGVWVEPNCVTLYYAYH